MDILLRKVTKPARYIGGEWGSVRKDWEAAAVRVALAYPDLYEVGMSNLGLAILYDILNRQPGILAERVYAPWVDMEKAMRAEGLLLFSLETKHPLAQFDILGFSLPYELNYTNALNMLDLAGLPVLSEERDESHPLVIAGGSCTYNPEPLAPFFDLFVIGDGEEVILELVRAYSDYRKEGRRSFLRQAAQIEGVYVPRLYEVSYNGDGTVKAILPKEEGIPEKVTKRLVWPLPPPPTQLVVPHLEAIHDRGMIEIQRGCTRGCRFCQAGIVYRPVRERPLEEILQAVEAILQATGHEEVGLLSLSSCDYSRIEELVRALVAKYEARRVSISLPSLRADSFSVELAKLIQHQRRIGLTFAPEAGTERLRQIINKPISTADILQAAEAAYQSGWRRVKLYFMVGLPGERMEDVEAIGGLVRGILDLGRRYQGRRTEVSVSVATFVPKSHTPFQWAAMEKEEALAEKQTLLRRKLRGPGLHLSWHEPRTTLLEAALARGDRRLAEVIRRAWRKGARFDAWDETFAPELWWQAFQEEGLDPHFYSHRHRPYEEVLPWDHIQIGVRKDFLWQEYGQALKGRATPDCRDGSCSDCGLRMAFGVPCGLP